MRFRLTTLLYLFALVAAALAAFGGAGVLVTVAVLLCLAALIPFPRLKLPRLENWMWLALAGVFVLIALLLLPAVQSARERSRHYTCLNNLKNLALAIHNYHATYKELPGAERIQTGSNYSHSWRVDILPYVEEQSLYDAYRRDESWDGPNNRKLKLQLYLHECPHHGASFQTSYFAVVGPDTVWGDGEPRTFDDVKDGAANTILLIEAARRGVDWKEPRDLTFDEAVDLLSSPIRPPGSDGHQIDYGYFYKSSYVRNVAMCDGSAHALRVPIDRQTAIALLTASGGEKINMDQLDSYAAPELDFGIIWAFSLFCVLALLPGIPPLRQWIWPKFQTEAEL